MKRTKRIFISYDSLAINRRRAIELTETLREKAKIEEVIEQVEEKIADNSLSIQNHNYLATNAIVAAVYRIFQAIVHVISNYYISHDKLYNNSDFEAIFSDIITGKLSGCFLTRLLHQEVEKEKELAVKLRYAFIKIIDGKSFLRVLLRERKRLKRRIRALCYINHLRDSGHNNNSQRKFLKLQSVRINDKSGDEINNLLMAA